ncbi:hypothetical protein WJX73_005290 [Symbiochloris irregularis]|uniref:Uncharacterized protein n=1 Tax=Symbiochloris irregularis TaxID=706552 RepID=A0AAW1PVD0_9CHLO
MSPAHVAVGPFRASPSAAPILLQRQQGAEQHARFRPCISCKSARRSTVVVKAAFALPQPTTSPWGIWTGLTIAGAVGFWSEKTRLGKELSGPLVSTLAGLLLSNISLIPCNAPQYGIVNKFLLPLAVPMLLFTADLKKILADTGKLLAAFCIGACATVAGTLVAFKILPLASLGADGWKVASALCARHIGGAINYVGVADTLNLSAAAQAAGLAADNLLCALYFTTVFQLARKIPADPAPEAAAAVDQQTAAPETSTKAGITVLEGATAVALSTALCYLSSIIAAWMNVPSALIPVATALTVALATAIPKVLAPLVASGEGIAAILLHVFFGAVGANASISAVIESCPALFFFCFLQIGVHLGLTLGVGRLFGFTRRDLLLASNANVGGPTTAAGMAAAKGWRLSLVPSLLVGTFGYATATFISCALGVTVLQKMAV